MSKDNDEGASQERFPAPTKRRFTEIEKYGFNPETAFRPFLIFLALLLSIIVVGLLAVLCLFPLVI